MYPVAPRRKTKKDAGLPGCTREEVESRVQQLPPEKMARVQGLLDEVAQEDFWRRERFVQIVRMIDMMEAHKVKQNDIAFVLTVSKSLVSRCKKYHRLNPIECAPRSGPKSVIDDIFPEIQFFIDGKTATERRSPWASCLALSLMS